MLDASGEPEISVYRERAHLIAFLAALYPAVISHSEPDQPEWPVITVTTPQGQMSWHLHKDDLGLFPRVPHVPADMAEWDGHTTAEKYERLARLTADVAAIPVTAHESPSRSVAPPPPSVQHGAFPRVEVVVNQFRVPRAVRVDGAEIRRIMNTHVRYEAGSMPVVEIAFRAGSFAETVEHEDF